MCKGMQYSKQRLPPLVAALALLVGGTPPWVILAVGALLTPADLIPIARALETISEVRGAISAKLFHMNVLEDNL